MKSDYNFFGGFRRLFKRIGNICWAAWNRNAMDYLIIHRRKLVKNPSAFLLPLLCGPVKGKLRCPPAITILLVHNYECLPIMEMSLRYVGIENYVVLRPQVRGPWRHIIKCEMIYDYLTSGSCKTEYVLYCDSDDAILRDDPVKAIRYLEEENCDLLFSCTKFKGRAYSYMPDVKAWADKIAKERGYLGWYLNAGVFFGRKNFVQEVLETVMVYAIHDDFSKEKSLSRNHQSTLEKNIFVLPEKALTNDQPILRYLHPRFYPRMKIDYAQRLALK